MVAVVVFSLLFIFPFPNDVNKLCDRAEFFLFNRHLNSTYLDSAYQLLAQIRTQDRRNERALYLWSRIHTQFGDDAKLKSEKIRYYERAKAVAESLKAINPKNPDGYMWWGIAQGKIGQTRGVLNSLFMVPGLKKVFTKVLELEPKYPTAYDALGVLYYELPKFAGGDLKKSEEYLIKGLAIDPNYTLIRLDLAKVYLKQGRYSEAEEQLRLLLKTTNPTYPADFFLEDKPEAERLLKEIEGRD